MSTLSVLVHMAAMVAAVWSVYFDGRVWPAAVAGHALAYRMAMLENRRTLSAVRRRGTATTVMFAAFAAFAAVAWLFVLAGAPELRTVGIVYGAAGVPTLFVALGSAAAAWGGAK
jgi:hypothetical protein